MLPKYECDHCGACCRGTLLVEAYDLDLLREPRLAEADSQRHGLSLDRLMADLQQEGRCLLIAGSSPCRFLGPDSLCTIHPTRPNVCVAMQAGDPQCQLARREEGLALLLPIVLPTAWQTPLKDVVVNCPVCHATAELSGQTPEAVVLQGLVCAKCGGRFECDPDDLFDVEADQAV